MVPATESNVTDTWPVRSKNNNNKKRLSPLSQRRPISNQIRVIYFFF